MKGEEYEKDTKGGPIKMSQLAAASGLTVSTIKFYMSQGLLSRPEKTKPNVAYYDDAFLRRLLVIKRMRNEGLSVNSIKVILDKYPFEKVTDWEDFKKRARKKEAGELEEEERLATLTGEQRRTEAILDAAFLVFSEKGYHNATVDDIAQQAGVSKGTCYQYFSGKEEIFVATLDRTLDLVFNEASAAASDQKLFLARLGFEGLTFIARFKELQFMFVGLYNEILGGNERLRKKAAEIFENVARFMAKDIEEGIRQKVFRPVDSMTIAYALLGIAAIAGSLSLLNEDFDEIEFMMDLVDFTEHGLFAHRKPT
jgi:AcrR family transcriptional regulator